MEQAKQKCREGKDNPFFTKCFISSNIGKSYFVALVLFLMESSLSFAEDLRNLFKLKKEANDPAINNIGNLFRLKKENETVKDRITRDIRNLFEYEVKDYFQPLRLYNSEY